MNEGGPVPLGVPPHEVLDAFGAQDGDREALAGGVEVSVRVGELVFKLVDDPGVAAWCQAALAQLTPTGWTLPRPRAARDGRWVVAGWIATEFVDGLRPFIDDASAVVEVGVDLAGLLAREVHVDAKPLRERTDRWAIADKVAWGELDPTSLTLRPEVRDLLRRLATHFDDGVIEPSVVVHGDLASNVFVDRSGVPVVLDVSPYVRPLRYGSAIVVVDHLLWFDGTSALSGLVEGDLDALARGLIFRIVAHQLGLPSGADHGLAEIMPIVNVLGL